MQSCINNAVCVMQGHGGLCARIGVQVDWPMIPAAFQSGRARVRLEYKGDAAVRAPDTLEYIGRARIERGLAVLEEDSLRGAMPTWVLVDFKGPPAELERTAERIVELGARLVYLIRLATMKMYALREARRLALPVVGINTFKNVDDACRASRAA